MAGEQMGAATKPWLCVGVGWYGEVQPRWRARTDELWGVDLAAEREGGGGGAG